MKTKTFVILNGTHYGRFFPYPKETNLDVTTIYPEQIRKIKNFNYLKKCVIIDHLWTLILYPYIQFIFSLKNIL